MWLFTDAADWFDRQAVEGEEIIDSWGTSVGKDYYFDPSYWNQIKMTSVAVGYAGYKFSTTVASGYVDTLRLGDGIKEGGWGYAKDALRALVVVGPALRAARSMAGSLRKIDVVPSLGNCTWVASTKALRLTGTRLFARVSQLAFKAGLRVNETEGAFVHELRWILTSLGARVTMLRTDGQPAFGAVDDVMRIAAQNTSSVVLFSVQWGQAAHTLIARTTIRGVRILDRTGKAVKSLKDLEPLYPGISTAKPFGTAALIHDAVPVTILENVSALGSFGHSILDQIALPVAPVLLYPVPVDPTGSLSHPKPVHNRPASESTRNKSSNRQSSGSSGTGSNTSGAGSAGKGGSTSSFSGGSRRTSPASRRRFDQKVVCSEDRTKCDVLHLYTTRPGDTLEEISKSAYGSDDFEGVIWSANVARVGRETTASQPLTPGKVLVIPMIDTSEIVRPR